MVWIVYALFIPRPSLDNTKSTAVPTKHLTNIADKQVRHFPSGKMTALAVLIHQNHRAHRVMPQPRSQEQLLRKPGNPQLDVDVARGPGERRAARGVGVFVVDALVRPRAGRGELVDAHPRQNLVVRPGVLVRPVVQLVVEPGEQADGVRGHGVRQRLWLGLLQFVVPDAFDAEPFASRDARLFPFRQRRRLQLCVQRRMTCNGRFVGNGEVDEMALHGFRVLQREQP